MNAPYTTVLGGMPVKIYGGDADPGSPLVIYHAFEEDGESVWDEYRRLGAPDCVMAAVETDDWESELSPWVCAPVFKNAPPFGDGAKAHLAKLEGEVIPELKRITGCKDVYICGYSLGGLFALWAVCNTRAFSGAAAVSPSVWFPGFEEYIRTAVPFAPKIYLSLGDREEKTRNPVMAGVGDSIRAIHAFLRGRVPECTLEWNEGNHFAFASRRTAKGIAWVLSESGKADK